MRRIGFPAVAITLAIIAVLGANRLPAQQAMTEELRNVVLFNAPYIIAETLQDYGFLPPSAVDHLLRVNFDKNLLGADNSQHAFNGYIPIRIPTVYYSIEETTASDGTGFYYIGYYFYHPNDTGFEVGPVGDRGHEHDMEGVFLIVQKATSWNPYGTPVLAWSEAHGALIPYYTPGLVDPSTALSQGGEYTWGGKILFRYDPAANQYRPVVAIAQSTHGTYMAQACGPGVTLGPPHTDGYGYNTSSGGTNVFGSCVHHNRWAILYEPAIDSYPFVGLPDWENGNTYAYRLDELATSPIWSSRGSGSTGLFTGRNIDLGHGTYGAEFFTPYAGAGDANPPWAWLGGGGTGGVHFGQGGWWYSFGQDGTIDGEGHPAPWPNFLPGELLMDPQNAARRFFPHYWPSGYNEPVVFN